MIYIKSIFLGQKSDIHFRGYNMDINEIKILFKNHSAERKLSYFNSGIHGILILDLKNYITINVYIDSKDNLLNCYFSNNRFENLSLNFNYDIKNFDYNVFIETCLIHLASKPLYKKLFIYMFDPSKNYINNSQLSLFLGKTHYILFENNVKPFDYYKLNNY